jgi:catechol 2,3-dioxygenase-like lactoylglutathione lyase family enzyme
MNADRDSNAARPGISAHVASCVIRVRELDPSLKFYCDVFSCKVAVRETEMALLVAPNGFHIYLHAPARHRRAGDTAGVQYLLWATDTESDLREITQRLRAHDPAVFTHIENGVTVIEGLDPDGGRVLIGYPSPLQLPRTVIAARLHA